MGAMGFENAPKYMSLITRAIIFLRYGLLSVNHIYTAP